MGSLLLFVSVANRFLNDESFVTCVSGTGWACESEAPGHVGAGRPESGVQGSPTVLPSASAGLIWWEGWAECSSEPLL